MMAFTGGGNQPVAPMLPGSLINARLGFTGQRRASDPFSPSSVSRSSSSTLTLQNKSPESQAWPSISSLTAGKTVLSGLKAVPDVSQGIASNQALGYLRTASLPHVPPQDQVAPGVTQQTETHAMSNPRKCVKSLHEDLHAWQMHMRAECAQVLAETGND